jgi:threonine synthase
MCQITYYFYSASRIENSENIVYSVPTGNFGDILAGYISKKMGLKFKKLIIATNENNILDIALKSGEHTIKDVVSTSSPSIDIQVSSNFERLVYDSCKDSSYVKEIMTNLKKEGTFTLTDECRAYISKYFTSDSASNNEVNQTILEYYSKYNITLDPHTAVGVVCGKKQSLSEDILVTLSTAHPAKFKETVSDIISDDSFVTEKVRMLENQEERMIIANKDVEEIKNIINERIL